MIQNIAIAYLPPVSNIPGSSSIGPLAQRSVGIWHETYIVNPNQFEYVYGNMPLFGLSAAMEHVQAIGTRETSRLHLGANKTVS